MDTQAKQPELTLRDGSLKATVWKNEGDKGAYFTTTFARTYTDAQGNARDTQSFSQTDLLRLAELGRETYGIINDLKREQSLFIEQSQDQKQAQAMSINDDDGRENFKQRRRQPQQQPQQQTHQQ